MLIHIPERYKTDARQFERLSLEDFAATCQRELNDANHDFWMVYRRRVEDTIRFGLYLYDCFDGFARELAERPENIQQNAIAVSTLFKWWNKPCFALMQKIDTCEKRGFKFDEKLKERFLSCWKESLSRAIDPRDFEAGRLEAEAGQGRPLREVMEELRGSQT